MTKPSTDVARWVEKRWGSTVVPATAVRQALAELDEQLRDGRRHTRAETAEERQALTRLPTVRLEVAYPLSLAAQERICTQLEHQLPGGAQLEIVVSPAVVAGAVVVWQGRRFDASWATSLERVKYDEI